MTAEATPAPSNRPTARVMLGLFCAVTIVHFAQVSRSNDLILRGNELSHIRFVHAIVVEGQLDIGPIPADLSYHDGKWYSNKPPGYAFSMAPGYAAVVAAGDARELQDTFLFLKAMSALLSAGTVALILWLLASYSLSRASLAFGTTAAVAGTIFPAYSCLANSLPLTLFLAAAAILCVRLSQLRPAAAHLRAIALFCCAYAVIVDYSNAFFLAPVAAVPVIDLVRRRAVRELWIFVPSIVPFALLACYNTVAFGDPLALSYEHYRPPRYVPWHGVDDALSLTAIPHGLFGLLLSPSRGLFLISPVTALGLVTLVRWVRERQWDRMWLAASVALGVLVMASYSLWHGGHSVGYRHILVAAVVLGALSAFAFERAGPRVRAALLALLAVSVATGVAAFFIQVDRHLLALTWKGEPADVHAGFYTELLWKLLTR